MQSPSSPAVSQSEARYRALFEAIDDGFCIIEFFDGPHGPLSDYVHVEANPGYERHTGIAGIVLTIGMAVDSNVLIYERIREEAKMGRSLISALDAGFNRAFATIVDSQSTMMVAAVILYFLGSGPVRGFAVSLGLGIITTIVTAVTMTRMMIALWYTRARPQKLPF